MNTQQPSTKPSFRFSGHETFVCRYTWLPKAIRLLPRNPDLFRDESAAMVLLGVGKNMVRSIKFWAETAQVIEPCELGYRVTPFGERLLGTDGHDPFLEQTETLWLLHWKIATNPEHPIYYWNQMLNFWHRSVFSTTAALRFLNQGLPPTVKAPSERTLADGLKVFVNTYIATKGKKGVVAEDSLDSPFVELGFLRSAGRKTEGEGSGLDSVYSFNLEDKPSVTVPLFAYCVYDYWQNNQPGEQTLAFRFTSTAEGSPGQVFKLPEISVTNRLEEMSKATHGALEFLESSSMPQVFRSEKILHDTLLDAIYEAKR